MGRTHLKNTSLYGQSFQKHPTSVYLRAAEHMIIESVGSIMGLSYINFDVPIPKGEIVMYIMPILCKESSTNLRKKNYCILIKLKQT